MPTSGESVRNSGNEAITCTSQSGSVGVDLLEPLRNALIAQRPVESGMA